MNNVNPVEMKKASQVATKLPHESLCSNYMCLISRTLAYTSHLQLLLPPLSLLFCYPHFVMHTRDRTSAEELIIPVAIGNEFEMKGG